MGNDCQPALTIAEQRGQLTATDLQQAGTPGSRRAPSGRPPALRKGAGRFPSASGGSIVSHHGPLKEGEKMAESIGGTGGRAAVFSRNSMVE
jgi:hypothetical protein